MHAFRLCIYGCVSRVYILLFWFIIYSNSAMPLLFLFRSKQHMVFCLMCSQAGRACWLCTASLLYPERPHPLLLLLFSSHTTLSVCLMPFPLRHGAGQPLRSGEVFRSQTPCEKALFPPVQKQISGLPCWDQVYVSVSTPASMCGMTTMWRENIQKKFICVKFAIVLLHCKTFAEV